MFKDRQLLIKGVWPWCRKIGTGSLFLNSLLLLCELHEAMFLEHVMALIMFH